MGLEIERKFLLDLSLLDFKKEKVLKIQQLYLLNEADRSIRIRIQNKNAFITIKTNKTPLIRNEYEYEIPLNEAEELFGDFQDKPSILKRRYLIQYKNHLWEVDVFEGDNAGLVIAEIELQDVDEDFEKPAWLLEEVTNDRKYLNANLVKLPFKDW